MRGALFAVEETIEYTEKVVRKWQLTDALPRGYANMDLVWADTRHLGAENRCQCEDILKVLIILRNHLQNLMGQDE